MERFVKSRKSNKMNVICRHNNILLVLLLLLLADNILAQTPKNDLSRGSYILLNKPFQIEAWGYPFRYDDTTNTTSQMSWDLDLFKTKSNYTNHMLAGWPLEWYPVGAGDVPWSKIEADSGDGTPWPLSAWELRDFGNVVRLQWEDDNLLPQDPAMVAIAKKWFETRLADPTYDDIILSIDLRPYGYTPADLDSMLIKLDPDLIMWNRYPHAWPSQGLNYRQIEYGWYAMLIYNRNVGLLGNGDVTKPVPTGAFTQAIRQGYANPMPHSRMYYNNFLNLLFGAKYLSTFLYTSWPLWWSEQRPVEDRDPNLDLDASGMVSTLFDHLAPFAPRTEFYVQAEINRQVSNIGKALVRLQTSGVRFIRAMSIEANVQSDGFAGGIYDWDYGTRPDTLLTDVTVTRTGFPETQDVWVGFFKPVHHTIDGSGTADENYFMVVNGCWDTNGTLTEQTIRLDFNFGKDTSINSLLRISRLTGEIEVVPLTLITGNTYYLDLVLDGGEGDLLKYNNGISFLLLE